MLTDIPAPWKGFLEKLDTQLEEPVRLDCIGGFAVVMGYGLPRATNDLDYRTLNPYNLINDLQRLAGPASALAKPPHSSARCTQPDPAGPKAARAFVTTAASHLVTGPAMN